MGAIPTHPTILFGATMKFRHKSNFVPLDLESIIVEIIRTPTITDTAIYSGHSVERLNIAKLLACILLKEDIESVLERFDYVKFDE